MKFNTSVTLFQLDFDQEIDPNEDFPNDDFVFYELIRIVDNEIVDCLGRIAVYFDDDFSEVGYLMARDHGFPTDVFIYSNERFFK